MPSLRILASAITAIGFAVLPSEVAAGELPEPAALTVASGSDQKQVDEISTAARTYAAFWNTGRTEFANAALSPDFVDRTLPEGRPQGKEGPLVASKTFRAAVPDLTASIDELMIAGDRAVVRLAFSGHFTGTFGTVKGAGRAISFRAIDIYRVIHGQITDNWHLEDNLTLMKQLGLVK